MIEIYTDGGFNPVLQQGGWGTVIIENGQKRTFSGSMTRTTNNRMEIIAAIEALKRVPANTEIRMFTDSQYLFGCMALGWARKANVDLFESLDKLTAVRQVKWQWIDQNVPNINHLEAHSLAIGGTTVIEKPASPEDSASSLVSALSHIDASGKPKMVDVSAKTDTEREATARCVIHMQPATYQLIIRGKITKGDVLTVAQIAGIMGAKHTPQLIPLCHPLLINEARVEFKPDEHSSTLEITTTVRCTGKTGVEMEALTAAAVAALTVYDMCKAVDRSMKIDNLRLIKKSGGKSGTIILE